MTSRLRVGGKLQQRQVVEAVPVVGPTTTIRVGLVCRTTASSSARTARSTASPFELVVRLVQKLEGDAARGSAKRGATCCQKAVSFVRQTSTSSEQGLKSCSSMMTPSPLVCASRTTSSSFASHGRIEPVLGVHVPERLQVQPDEIEAGLADLGEVPPFEAALARVGPIGIVAEHVDAAVERLIGLVENGGRSSRRRVPALRQAPRRSVAINAARIRSARAKPVPFLELSSGPNDSAIIRTPRQACLDAAVTEMESW